VSDAGAARTPAGHTRPTQTAEPTDGAPPAAVRTRPTLSTPSPADWIGAARLALAFLTRIPVGQVRFGVVGLSRAALFFPAVGLLVGGVAAGVRAGGGEALTAPAATVLALLAAVLITGAMHEDGLADAADGLGAHVTRERKLEIMRDSRVGTYGALAIAFSLLFAFAVLAPLNAEDFARTVVCAHVLARWSTLPLARFVRSARAEGAGSAVTVGTGTLIVGTAYAAAIVLVVAGPANGAAALGGACVAAALCASISRRALGGMTGDTFGAAIKLTELTTYGVLAALIA
jgi:adenosylcobinamide-GDP ribazoletransferase